ncbi:hypothetical protein MAUB1S_03370 [Mycolicibacterium aubagnense]
MSARVAGGRAAPNGAPFPVDEAAGFLDHRRHREHDVRRSVTALRRTSMLTTEFVVLVTAEPVAGRQARPSSTPATRTASRSPSAAARIAAVSRARCVGEFVHMPRRWPPRSGTADRSPSVRRARSGAARLRAPRLPAAAPSRPRRAFGQPGHGGKPSWDTGQPLPVRPSRPLSMASRARGSRPRPGGDQGATHLLQAARADAGSPMVLAERLAQPDKEMIGDCLPA